MTFEIEKGVPVPFHAGRGAAKYPFKEMEVGDSFFVPGLKSTADFSAEWYAQKRTGMKFTKRAVDGGVRIWRTK